MSAPILGIHHITAIATDPQPNLDFYTQVLGLRLVKKTVNFDDPGTYHLYFGDELGRPGTILTFFPWPRALRGSRGTGQVTVTAFSVPTGSLDYWIERLEKEGVVVAERGRRFEEQYLTLLDPDGLKLELVAHPQAEAQSPWSDGPIPEAAAIRGFHSVTLTLEGYESTAALLTETMGFHAAGDQLNRFRFATRGSGPGSLVDLLCSPDTAAGHVAAGTVHHVAFRVASHEDQVAARELLIARGMNVTPILDRNYFESIYFREPGGTLFEIATDPPGFTADESPEELGTNLKLPAWLESHRSQIEGALPELVTPR